MWLGFNTILPWNDQARKMRTFYFWGSDCSRFFLCYSSNDIPEIYEFWSDIGCTWKLQMFISDARMRPQQLGMMVTTQWIGTLHQIISQFNVDNAQHICQYTAFHRVSRISYLTLWHQLVCLTGAREHSHWPVEDWCCAAWSDESYFKLLQADCWSVCVEETAWGYGSCLSAGYYVSW